MSDGIAQPRLFFCEKCGSDDNAGTERAPLRTPRAVIARIDAGSADEVRVTRLDHTNGCPRAERPS